MICSKAQLESVLPGDPAEMPQVEHLGENASVRAEQTGNVCCWALQAERRNNAVLRC